MSRAPAGAQAGEYLRKPGNAARRLAAACRLFLLRRSGVGVGRGSVLEAGVQVRLGVFEGMRGRIQIGERCQLSAGVVLDSWGGAILVGSDVFLGPYTVVYGHGGVRIGDGTLVAMHCRILSSEHTIPERARRIRALPDRRLPTTIGADVWLGAGVTVLGGVTIGDGCVVAAGSVVVDDVPPYSVVAGVPASVRRSR